MVWYTPSRMFGVLRRAGLGVWLFACFLFLLGAKARSSDAAREDFSFRIKGGLLSVDVRGASLGEVLRAIAAKAGVRLILMDSAREEVFVRFEDLPLDQGLRRILARRNYLFLYGSRGLELVGVYSPRREGRLGPKPQGTFFVGDLADAELQRLARSALEAGSPEERAEAVEELGSLDDEGRVAGILMQVLEGDKDPQIRKAALEVLEDLDEVQDVQREAALISLKDPVEANRLLAVEILEDQEAWEELRRVAESHEDPKVRESAAEVLEDASP